MRLLDWLRQDIAYSLRLMARARTFTAVVVLSLGLGVGGTTAIFSLIDVVLLRSLPVTNPDELFFLAHGEGEDPGTSSNYLLFESYGALPVFSGATAFRAETFQLGEEGSVELVSGQFVSGNYHALIGAPLALGRGFVSEPDRPGGDPGIAVISDGFWARRFDRSPDVLGRTLTVSGHAVTVVGVTAPGFEGLMPGTSIDITVPLSLHALDNPGFLDGLDYFTSMPIVARIRPGVSEAAAETAVKVAFDRFMEQPAIQWAQGTAYSQASLIPAGRGEHGLRQQYRVPLLALMAMSVLVLLIASANTANLLLARSTVRAREVVMRMCVGAGRGRLIGQFLTESVILALAGGLTGLVFASWGTSAIVALFSVWRQPLELDVSMNLRIFGFAGSVAIVTGLVFGILPALRVSAVDLASGLKGAPGRQYTGGTTRLNQGLMVAQVALCVVIVTVSALLAQSVRNLKTQPAGFEAGNLVLLDASCAGTLSPASDCGDLVSQLVGRLSALPGTTSVAASTMTPANTRGSFRGLALEELPSTPEARGATANQVSDGYFGTMGIRLLRGRVFTEQDVDLNRKVAVLNERTARYIFGEEEPIGRTIAWMSAPDDPIEVIGVVEDTRQHSLREEAPRTVYTPLADWPFGVQVAIRTKDTPAALAPAVRDLARQVSSDLIVASVRTMNDQINGLLVRERALMFLSISFALVASVLACIGLYGLMSFHVGRRTREIGIRLALGEMPRSVSAGILRHATLLACGGIAIGVMGAAAATRLVSAFLYGLSPQDPLTLAGVGIGIAVVAVLASWQPARRAAKLDPLAAIRAE